MPPLEGTVEMSVSDYIRDGHAAPAVETQGFFLDVDKPWHILEANDWMTERLCSQLTGHELAEGAGIDDTAVLQGYVKLGRNSRIGRNVVVHGNLIVGDDTVIDNGAILKGSNVIGDRTVVANYCCIERNTTIGSDCNVNHCAELSGLIMDRVYLYHYMEFYGVIGEATDLGAATVCGTLRFDDGETIHTVKGRKEFPGRHANAVFLGDYSRTGVNVILMPGRKVGVYSVVGSGVVLNEDVPDRTLVYVKQELGKSTWGPERYGW